VPITALALVAAVAAALFVSQGASRTPRALSSTAPQCDGDKTKLNLSGEQSVESVAMVSTTEGWAVGVDRSTGSSLIVHGQNCVWTPITTTFPHVGLISLSMGAPDEGWALGIKGGWFVTSQQGASTGSALLHYTGGKWQQVNLDLGEVGTRSKIVMVSSSDGWMYVQGGITPGPTSKLYQNTVWHYQNGTWSKVALPFVKPTTQIWGLAALPSGDCWVVGYDALGVIGHYRNGAWSSIRTQQTYYDVAMSSPTDGWAVGNQTLMHYDGTGWHDASGQLLNTSGVSELDSVMYSTPSEAWAFYEPFESGSSGGSYTGQQESVLHLKDGKWAWESSPLGPIDFVRQLSMASTTEGWAVGVVHDDNNPYSFYRGVLVRYHQGAWTSYEPFVPTPGVQTGPVG
jgi:hypothetical protein